MQHNKCSSMAKSSVWLMGKPSSFASELQASPPAAYPGSSQPGGLPSELSPVCFPSNTQAHDVALEAHAAACSYLDYNPQEFNKAHFKPQGVNSGATGPMEFHLHHHHHHYLPQQSMASAYLSGGTGSHVAPMANEFTFRGGAPVVPSFATKPSYSSLGVREASVAPSYGQSVAPSYGQSVAPSYGPSEGYLPPAGPSHAVLFHSHEPDLMDTPPAKVALQNVFWFKNGPGHAADDIWSSIGAAGSRPAAGVRLENLDSAAKKAAAEKLLGKDLGGPASSAGWESLTGCDLRYGGGGGYDPHPHPRPWRIFDEPRRKERREPPPPPAPPCRSSSVAPPTHSNEVGRRCWECLSKRERRRACRLSMKRDEKMGTFMGRRARVVESQRSSLESMPPEGTASPPARSNGSAFYPHARRRELVARRDSRRMSWGSETSLSDFCTLKSDVEVHPRRPSNQLEEPYITSDKQRSRRASLLKQKLKDGRAMAGLPTSSHVTSSSRVGSLGGRKWKDRVHSPIKRKGLKDRRATRYPIEIQDVNEKQRIRLDTVATSRSKSKKQPKEGHPRKGKRPHAELADMEGLSWKHTVCQKGVSRERKFKKLACQGFQARKQLRDAMRDLESSARSVVAWLTWDDEEEHAWLFKKSEASIFVRSSEATTNKAVALMDEESFSYACPRQDESSSSYSSIIEDAPPTRKNSQSLGHQMHDLSDTADREELEQGGYKNWQRLRRGLMETAHQDGSQKEVQEVDSHCIPSPTRDVEKETSGPNQVKVQLESQILGEDGLLENALDDVTTEQDVKLEEIQESHTTICKIYDARHEMELDPNKSYEVELQQDIDSKRAILEDASKNLLEEIGFSNDNEAIVTNRKLCIIQIPDHPQNQDDTLHVPIEGDSFTGDGELFVDPRCLHIGHEEDLQHYKTLQHIDKCGDGFDVQHEGATLTSVGLMSNNDEGTRSSSSISNSSAYMKEMIGHAALKISNKNNDDEPTSEHTHVPFDNDISMFGETSRRSSVSPESCDFSVSLVALSTDFTRKRTEDAQSIMLSPRFLGSPKLSRGLKDIELAMTIANKISDGFNVLTGAPKELIDMASEQDETPYILVNELYDFPRPSDEILAGISFICEDKKCENNTDSLCERKLGCNQTIEETLEDMNRRLTVIESYMVKLQDTLERSHQRTYNDQSSRTNIIEAEQKRTFEDANLLDDVPSGFTSVYQSPVFVQNYESEGLFRLANGSASLPLKNVFVKSKAIEEDPHVDDLVMSKPEEVESSLMKMNNLSMEDESDFEHGLLECHVCGTFGSFLLSSDSSGSI